MRYTEEPVVFMNEGMRIVGMLHSPETDTRPPAVVFYHGCTGSRNESHWMFVRMARHFAERGIMSLRFDFRFSGESEGSFQDMTFSGEVADGVRAVDYLVECGAAPKRIGILGYSMGGAVAAFVAGNLRERVKSCVLMNPVGRPLQDLAFVAQKHEVDMTSFPVELNSFLFGRKFAEELPNIRPLEMIVRATCPVLVVSATADRTIDPARSREYCEALRTAGVPVEFFPVEGADHTFASAAWKRVLAEKTGAWFTETL